MVTILVAWTVVLVNHIGSTNIYTYSLSWRASELLEFWAVIEKSEDRSAAGPNYKQRAPNQYNSLHVRLDNVLCQIFAIRIWISTFSIG